MGWRSTSFNARGTWRRRGEGVSLAYSFNDAEADDRRLTRYFEILGNRAIYQDGWLAGTVHYASELRGGRSQEGDVGLD